MVAAQQVIGLENEQRPFIKLRGFPLLACNRFRPTSTPPSAKDISYLVHKTRVLKINVFDFGKLF